MKQMGTQRVVAPNRIFVDRTRDVASSRRKRPLIIGLTGPNLRGSGVDHGLAQRPIRIWFTISWTSKCRGIVGDCYDRYLVRMEEMRQSCVRAVCRPASGGPENKSGESVNISDGKDVLPSKNKVLTSMEELIHQFMLVTEE